MFEGTSFVVDGLHIPSDNPVFLTILAVHIVSAFVCLIAGIVAMFAKKQHGIHPKAGTVYYWSLLAVFITVTIIAIGRWAQDYYLFILGLISFGSAFMARLAVRNKWQKWSIIHITGMGFSYIILITSFYVDNGKFLPIWKDFSPIVYWLFPSVIGVPIIIRTLLRHPLSRNYFKKG
jgi:hypothetical protein